MKHRLLLPVLLVILLSSCGIQKRLYRPGFYIPERSFVKTPAPAANEAEEPDTVLMAEAPLPAKTAEESTVVKGEEEPVSPAVQPVAVQSRDPYRKIKQIVPAIVHVQQKLPQKNHPSKKSYDGSDALMVVGLALLITGLVAVLLSVGMPQLGPVITNAMLVGGVIMLLLGIIVACIANPELFFDILLEAIFDAIIGAL
jgi:hypothetical protein